jgi:hypothetical protein
MRVNDFFQIGATTIHLRRAIIMKFAGIVAVGIGIIMLAQWGFYLLTEPVPEIQTEQISLTFYLAAEALTAIGLIGAGWAC